MKKKTKDNLIKGSIAGAIGAAVAGGAAYLLSNKKNREKLGNFVNNLEEKGSVELEKLLKSVKSAKNQSLKRVQEVSKDLKEKNKNL